MSANDNKIRMQCPECKTTIRGAPSLPERIVACPKCKKEVKFVKIPDAPPPAPPPPVAPADDGLNPAADDDLKLIDDTPKPADGDGLKLADDGLELSEPEPAPAASASAPAPGAKPVPKPGAKVEEPVHLRRAREAEEQRQKAKKNTYIIGGIGCAGLLLLALVAWFAVSFKGEKTEASWRQYFDKENNNLHDGVVREARKKMANPNSFEHVRTVISEAGGGYLFVRMTYRGINAFDEPQEWEDVVFTVSKSDGAVIAGP